MGSFVVGWISTLATMTTIALIILFGRSFADNYSRNSWWLGSSKQVSISKPVREQGESAINACESSNGNENDIAMEDLRALKKLYYQLHNLEKFPEALPGAKRLLLSLLKETSAAAWRFPEHQSLLCIPEFSRAALENFQRRRDNKVGEQWEQYNLRRKEGQPREIFEDREEASWWLRQISPVKYVDGAWLGHLAKVTTPFLLQKTTKGAWQILSEELGDGDPEKNHVHVYQKLLEAVGNRLPDPHELDFIHPRNKLNQLSVWKAATTQLLISLFPSDFLPEILGFNLHFEAISMDTLKAGKELREVGIDPYYFILHISIDNSHSGHSAIAIEVVCEYLEYIRGSEGDEAVQNAWEKVQSGYSLSLGLQGAAVCPSRRKSIDYTEANLSPIQRDVIRIFKGKAQVVHGIHCGSKAKIGCRTVADWLNPVELESINWQMELLDALSCSRYWIKRGVSSESRFIQELQWNGRMFGSFTQDEFETLRSWIDNMPNVCLALEGPGTEQHISTDDILSGYPALDSRFRFSLLDSADFFQMTTAPFAFHTLPSLRISDEPAFDKFLPLWLSHPCLLQAFVAIPFRTKQKFECTVVKILRAQRGFDIEQECVAGMGEVRRLNSLGLTGIGMNMMLQHGVSITELSSLKHILRSFPSDFAVSMLHISMRPLEYKGLLIGMATAFAKMHVMIARSRLPIFYSKDIEILLEIGRRELEGLEHCWNGLPPLEVAQCRGGYLIATREIEKCFRS